MPPNESITYITHNFKINLFKSFAIECLQGMKIFPQQQSFTIIQPSPGIKGQMLLKGHLDRYIEKCNQL